MVTKQFIAIFFGELLGTFILVFFGTAIVAIAVLFVKPSQAWFKWRLSGVSG